MTPENPYAPPRAFQDAAPVVVDLKTVKRRLMFPGVFMILNGIGMTIVAANAIHQNLVKLNSSQKFSHYGIVEARFLCGLFGVILLASLFFVYCGGQMVRKRRYNLCVAASVIMMIPFLSPGLVLGIPFGIWALVILLRKDTRAAFAETIQAP